jgi:hypothetical protein
MARPSPDRPRPLMTTRPALPRSLPLALLAAAILTCTSPAGAQPVDTRLGTLQLENGFPSKAAVEKLYDEMDFQRATQLYLWGLPAVGFHNLRQAHLRDFGAKDGEVVLYQSLADKAGMLTPNLTTLYAFSFWNLAERGPLVVVVPPGATAGGINDIWQRPVTDMGQTGPDKGKGAKYLILPPGGPKVEAPGHIVVRSPSNQIWFGSRGLSADIREAEATVRRHRLYAWSDRARPAATNYVPVGGRPWASWQPNDVAYFQQLRDVLDPEPPEARDGYFLAMLRSLGIEQGRPFAPTDRQRRILGEAAKVGELMARANAFAKRFPGASVFAGTQWEYANMVELDQQARGFSQLDERASWFYEAIGNTLGMQGRTVGFGQVYLETARDRSGAWLDGGKSYRLRVPPDAPVLQFWSFTLYDNVTRAPLQTPQGAADISSRKAGLVKNADGSVDLHFGPTPPSGANANFVQTVPGKGWFTYFRLYGPTAPYFEKRWALPDLDEVR